VSVHREEVYARIRAERFATASTTASEFFPVAALRR